MTPFGRYLLARWLTVIIQVPLVVEVVYGGRIVLRDLAHLPTWGQWVSITAGVVIVAEWPHTAMAIYRFTHQPYRFALTACLWLLSLATMTIGFEQMFVGAVFNSVLQTLVSIAAGVLPVLVRARGSAETAVDAEHAREVTES